MSRERWAAIGGPEMTRHGEAWSAFHRTIATRPVAVSDAALRHDWLTFLAGWVAKGIQRATFGKR